MKSVLNFGLLSLAALSFGCSNSDGLSKLSDPKVPSIINLPETGTNQPELDNAQIESETSPDDAVVLDDSLREENTVLRLHILPTKIEPDVTNDVIKDPIQEAIIKSDEEKTDEILPEQEVEEKKVEQDVDNESKPENVTEEIVVKPEEKPATPEEKPAEETVETLPTQEVKQEVDKQEVVVETYDDSKLVSPTSLNDIKGQVFKAIDSCDYEGLGKILETEALDRSGVSDKSNYTPLMRAIMRANKRQSYNCRDTVAQQLLDYGVDINERHGLGYTALHLAVIHHDPFSIQALMAHPEIDPNARDLNGYTPLIWSVYQNYGHKKSLEPMVLLLEHGNVDINAQDNSGKTALMHAAIVREIFLSRAYNGPSFGRGPEITRILLTRPDIDVSIDDSQGFRAIDYAVARNHEVVVEILSNFNSKEMERKRRRAVTL